MVKKIISASEAVATAVKLCKPGVVAVYPITPQTHIVEHLAELVADGELDAQYIPVESEHSAMAALVGASSVGVRTFTATSSQGLALMHEMLHWASGARLPIVMANINRAMGAPWSVWTDQNDSLSQRDTGWMQVYCESNQEVLDTVLQAYRVAEKVFLPAMVVLDAFVLSHTAEPVEIPSQEQADGFLPPLEMDFSVDVNNPRSYNGLATPDSYMELRQGIQESMDESLREWEKVDEEFNGRFGRRYGLVESYFAEEAELLLITSSTITSTAREVIDELRNDGRRVGLLKIRLFRPFPVKQLRRAVGGAPRIAVIDRNIGFGVGGIFAQEVKAALYNHLDIPVFSYIAGLGGRDVTPATIRQIVDHAESQDAPGETYWIGVRK